MCPTNIVTDIKKDDVLNDAYVVVSEIGKHYKEVFLCKHIRTDEEVVIKVERKADHRCSRLDKECRLYKLLSGGKGFPRLLNSFDSVSHSFMVLEKLGDNLHQIHMRSVKSGHLLSLKTIAKYADEMIARVANCHLRNVVHRDIKPENFVVDANGKELYLIDFNLANIFSENYAHIPYATHSPQCSVGNIQFLSINAHNGVVQTRRDDMLSIGYSLIYLAKGELPWSDIRSKNKTRKEHMEAIREIKLKVSVEELCSGLPKQFTLYMNSCSQLDFYAKPDYIYLRQLFREILDETHKSEEKLVIACNDDNHIWLSN